MPFYTRLSRTELLGLYRNLLRQARHFPSIKRDAIYQDIRLEWREKAGLSDPAALAQAVEVALRGLETLQKYTGMEKSAVTWSVTMEQDPLGEADAQQKRAERLAAEAAARKQAAAARKLAK